MPATVRQIADSLARRAPLDLAESWDNVGLQVGDAGQEVTRGLVALDATPQVLGEAVRTGAQVVVTHHPLLFKPARQVIAGAGPGGIVWAFARAGVSLICVHTNLDAARGGVSHALAHQLGLQGCRALRPTPERFAKLIAFVPADHADALRDALSAAGAGQLGDYDACSFSTDGTGTFRPLEGAQPWTGTPAGELAREPEVRLEMLAPRSARRRLTAALREAHPYEEPAFDWIEVQQDDPHSGFGAVGELASPMEADAFLDHVCRSLGTPAVRAVVADGPVRRVAVCGGSGSSFLPAALAAGCDAYVTADVTYHLFFDALDEGGRPRLTYVSAGHYETERACEGLLVQTLQEAIPQTEWARTQTRTDPSRVHVGR
jgi:dinuclear metal center YbgI/SA1388 family protein